MEVLSKHVQELVEYKFNKRWTNIPVEVKIEDHAIPQVTKFKYHGSIIQNDFKIEEDVNHRTQTKWLKCRSASGVIYD
ncbi:hypothetical protein Lal_00047125 [Lupinus albus]|nr:hypothetical protein Lal_00047125 [Lupinus albus]